ncbi:hypothetical protein CROQUDRAFT_660557 [Cronartium quercuum f. sp. fusiforme G11]|uniref:Uncharacterized protein n=1 Tax=Cronartium quercuum f. sp. fusiforme G11 TaxID=708437 RepID=A0A9P6T9U1_9BASI|nr:hypothetical protein CROQUDRAFT_660557 [Cronartium quercuum f. sp. fusiforme G11]
MLDSEGANMNLQTDHQVSWFYKLVLDADNLFFNGKNTVTDLKDLTDFELPTDSDSQAAIACLAPIVSAETSSHLNIDEWG